MTPSCAQMRPAPRSHTLISGGISPCNVKKTPKTQGICVLAEKMRPAILHANRESHAFALHAHAASADEAFEQGLEKVALFINAFDVPTHAARQLPSRRYTSKIGESKDIEPELRTLAADFQSVVAAV